REPRRRDLLRGRAILRRGSVRVASLADPALTVRRAIADVGAIDLLNRRITVRSVSLRGALLALQPDTATPIPVLPTALPNPPAARGRRPRPARCGAPRGAALGLVGRALRHRRQRRAPARSGGSVRPAGASRRRESGGRRLLVAAARRGRGRKGRRDLRRHGA